MAISVEKLSGLEYKLHITVPAETIEPEVEKRLKNLAHKVKIHGFRPGKVPMHVVRKRYLASVYEEVAKENIEPTFVQALKAENLMPASYPAITFDPVTVGQDFSYTAIIEVFPQFDIQEIGQEAIELITSEVHDADVDHMINELRKEHAVWNAVERAAVTQDKVVIDFEGFIGDEAFEGGKAEFYELILGSGSLIPGFEESLVGAQIGKPLDIHVTFPENYGQEKLAGQAARFHIVVHNIMEPVLPEVDKDFVQKFNVKDGDVNAFRQDIKDNMVRELERRVSSMNREKIFDQLLEKNAFDLPKSLIDQEIEHLKHEMYHRLFGHEHHDNEKIPDFPRELFDAQAKRRVHLGLLFSEYVKKHQIEVDKARVDAMIENLANAYESPDELRSWYHDNKKNLADIEAFVIEEMVAEKIIQEAQVTKKALDYADVTNKKK